MLSVEFLYNFSLPRCFSKVNSSGVKSSKQNDKADFELPNYRHQAWIPRKPVVDGERENSKLRGLRTFSTRCLFVNIRRDIVGPMKKSAVPDTTLIVRK